MIRLIPSGIALLVLLCGCESTATLKGRYSRLFIDGTDGETAMREAEAVLRDQYDYQLATVDRVDRRIETVPRESLRLSPSTRLSGTIGTAERTREWVGLRFVATTAGTDAYCRASLERYEPDPRASLSPSYWGTDTETGTPIDRGQAVTDSSEGRWVLERRDQLLERQILKLLEARCASPAASDRPISEQDG